MSRVFALSIGAWGTIINTRTGEEFGGTIHTLRLDDTTLTPNGILYCRPFEISEKRDEDWDGHITDGEKATGTE